MFFRGQIVGKYKIVSTIGSGGFGTVYLAEDTWIDKKVALKVPHKQSVDFGQLLHEPRLLAADSGLLKVADFGTSRFLEIAAHGTTVIGSPPYMAPEQFQGKAVFASDIYSLGVTVYQMLTGRLPYDTPSPADIDRLLRGDF